MNRILILLASLLVVGVKRSSRIKWALILGLSTVQLLYYLSHFSLDYLKFFLTNPAAYSYLRRQNNGHIGRWTSLLLHQHVDIVSDLVKYIQNTCGHESLRLRKNLRYS